MNNKNNLGFTLIELMFVILIIGVLVAIAIPTMTKITAKAKISEVGLNLSTYEKLQQTYFSETSTMGNASQIKFTNTSNLKYFTYLENFTNPNSDAGYSIATNGIIGDCQNGQKWETLIKINNQAIAVRSHPSDPICSDYLPNF